MTKPWPQSLTLNQLCRLDAILETGIASLEHAGYTLDQRVRRSREFLDAHALVHAELNRRAAGRAVRDGILALKQSGYYAARTATRAAS